MNINELKKELSSFQISASSCFYMEFENLREVIKIKKGSYILRININRNMIIYAHEDIFGKEYTDYYIYCYTKQEYISLILRWYYEEKETI